MPSADATVSSTVQNLWSEVLRCPTKRIGHVVILHVELAQPKIAKGNVSCVIEKDVFRLEIAADVIGMTDRERRRSTTLTDKQRLDRASVRVQEGVRRYRSDCVLH
jgi:hypothetical protein